MEALPAISEVLCEGWMVKSPPVPPVETKIIPGYSLFKAVRIFFNNCFSDCIKVYVVSEIQNESSVTVFGSVLDI